MQSIKTPTWIMKHINDNGLKICPIICEMPESEMLQKLQDQGKFNEAIIKQMVKIIYSLQGNSFPGIEAYSFEPFLEKDYDLFLIMFQKDFSRSTQTVVLATKKLNKEVLTKYNDRSFSGQLLKTSEPYIKLDLEFMYNETTITLAYFGKQEHSDESDWDMEIIKKKIA